MYRDEKVCETAEMGDGYLEVILDLVDLVCLLEVQVACQLNWCINRSGYS